MQTRHVIILIVALSTAAIVLNEMLIAGLLSSQAGKFIAYATVAPNLGLAVYAVKQSNALLWGLYIIASVASLVLIGASTPIVGMALLMHLFL